MKYNIEYEVAAIFCLLLLCIYIYKIYEKQSESNRQFKILVLLALASNILDVVTAITISYGAVLPTWINWLLNTFYYLTSAILVFRLVCYVSYYAYYEKTRKKIICISEVILAVYTFALIVNLFTGFIASFTAAGEYVHGPAYSLIYLFPFFFISGATIIVFVGEKKISPRQKISLCCFLGLSFSGAALQYFFFPDYLLSMFSVMVGTFLIFLLMETPDYHRLKKTIKELEETKSEAEEAREIAQQANLAKTEFLYNMSQEIQSPISVIMGYNEMIMNETKESSISSYSANIQSAGRTLVALVSDITDVTKLDEGNLNLNPVAYSVRSMLQDMVSYSQYNAKKRNLEVRLKIDEKIPQRLIGDVVRIAQMLNKIISNAVRYTSEGFISIEVCWEPMQSDKGILRFSVQDSGAGMSPEIIRRITNSHLLVGRKQDNPSQGIGLGLTVVTKILKSMDSKLEINSKEGEGSIFSFGIVQQIADISPIGEFQSEIQYASSENEKPEKMFLAPRAKVLVVDDNSMNLELMKGILKPTRILVDTALNGEEAILCLKKRKYNIVFLDHLMPVLGGVETMKRIREENLCEGIPVFAFTASAVQGEKEMFLNAGFEDVIIKPIIGKNLLQLVRNNLPAEFIMDRKDIFNQRAQGKFDFLDVKSAMEYCNNKESLFIEMLRSYVKNDRREELQQYFDKKDWKNYEVLIHALKSTSLSIGAKEIYEQAKSLEEAAKENKIQFMKERHEQVMQDYHELAMKIDKTITPVEQVKEEEPEKHVALEHILVVDDEKMDLQLAERLLSKHYRISTLSSGENVVEFLEKESVDLVLLDVHMPKKNGFEVMADIASAGFSSVPVIFLTADGDKNTEIEGFEAGAQDFISKPFIADIMVQRIQRVLKLSNLQEKFSAEVEKQISNILERRKKMERVSFQVMEALASSVDAKSIYMKGHSKRVAEYARLIAERMGKSLKEQEEIYCAGLLHDIGKIGIPDKILGKIPKLTEEEWQVIKTHPLIGADILDNISEVPDIDVGARWHHERYDGKGYPDGLKGTDIPETARIIGVADAYDAMTSSRSYRDELEIDTVRQEIEKGIGTQFDPHIASIFLQIIDENKEYKTTGE